VCGGAVGGVSLEGVDVGTATVISGTVQRDGLPVSGAYVRLLDSSGEFTAEVISSATGRFRFFAAPGSWTLRAMAPGGRGEQPVDAAQGEVVEATVELAA
jgi:hypothetical protein